MKSINMLDITTKLSYDLNLGGDKDDPGGKQPMKFHILLT